MSANLIIFANIILCSFFLFPIGFSFLPEWLNTKVMMAVVGVLIVYRDVKHTLDIPGYIFGTFVFATIFSCVGLFSVLHNETSDYAYAGYLASMSVWLSSACFLLKSIGHCHNYLSYRLIINYLLVVCLLQCFFALLIEYNILVKIFIDTYIVQIAGGAEFLNDVDRLYGIGAALDPAGVRFAAVLILVSVLLNIDDSLSRHTIFLYSVLFLLLLGLGNLISRTTTVGGVIGFIYLLGTSLYYNITPKGGGLKVLIPLAIALICVFLLGAFVYIKMEEMQELIHYGFEAFFNWFDRGEFTTDSTETLNTMWVFPENIKTWLIGDGWFASPNGEGGHYMFTDIGYLRFIFYCGMVGLIMFSAFFIFLTYRLGGLFPAYRDTFYLLLLFCFIVWVKVATDLFQFYALFLAMAAMPELISDKETKHI